MYKISCSGCLHLVGIIKFMHITSSAMHGVSSNHICTQLYSVEQICIDPVNACNFGNFMHCVILFWKAMIGYTQCHTLHMVHSHCSQAFQPVLILLTLCLKTCNPRHTVIARFLLSCTFAC